MTQNKNVRFFYLTDPKNPKRRACIVRKIIKYKDGSIGFEFAWSINNPVDKFTKKTARELALGRLSFHPYFITPHSGERVIKKICACISSKNFVAPVSLKRMANEWLALEELVKKLEPKQSKISLDILKE